MCLCVCVCVCLCVYTRARDCMPMCGRRLYAYVWALLQGCCGTTSLLPASGKRIPHGLGFPPVFWGPRATRARGHQPYHQPVHYARVRDMVVFIVTVSILFIRCASDFASVRWVSMYCVLLFLPVALVDTTQVKFSLPLSLYISVSQFLSLSHHHASASSHRDSRAHPLLTRRR